MSGLKTGSDCWLVFLQAYWYHWYERLQSLWSKVYRGMFWNISLQTFSKKIGYPMYVPGNLFEIVMSCFSLYPLSSQRPTYVWPALLNLCCRGSGSFGCICGRCQVDTQWMVYFQKAVPFRIKNRPHKVWKFTLASLWSPPLLKRGLGWFDFPHLTRLTLLANTTRRKIKKQSIPLPPSLYPLNVKPSAWGAWKVHLFT